jgi:hypothetical protein
MSELREVIHRALRNHSSPTIGRGAIHGGQRGMIVYEPSLRFVVAEIEQYLETRSNGRQL